MKILATDSYCEFIRVFVSNPTDYPTVSRMI